MFDLNYLDCSKSQYVSYLKHKGFPVEALYYSCLDTSDEIYEQIINQKKSRWIYDELGFQHEDWTLIGVRKRNVYAESLDSLRHGINRLTEEGKVVFVSVEVFHVPHRHLTYQKEKSPHSLMINGIAPDGEIYILDETAPVFSHFKYPLSLLEQCYQEGTGFRYITFFEEMEKCPIKDIQQEANRLFNRHLDRFDDTHILHKYLLQFLVTQGDIDFINTLKQLSAAYTLQSGSREMFSKFLTFINMDKAVVEKAITSSEMANQIRNSLNKAILRGKLKSEMLTKKVLELICIEQDLVSQLKARR